MMSVKHRMRHLRTASTASGAAFLVLAALALILPPPAASQEETAPEKAATVVAEEQGIAAFEEHLGEFVPGDILLRDELGNEVVLADFIDKPTILNFVYFECPGICTPLLNEIADILGKSGLHPDETPFQILTVSFEPTDTPAMALAKRNNYLELVGRPVPPETWRFFTTDAENIKRFTEATGFRYMRAGTEYTHPGGILFLSPDRKIVRYFYGLQFLPFDFQMGVYEAARGKVTPTTARLLRFCFSYDPAGRTYVFNLARVIGTVMLVSIVFFVIFLLFSTRHRRRKEA